MLPFSAGFLILVGAVRFSEQQEGNLLQTGYQRNLTSRWCLIFEGGGERGLQQ